MKITEIEVVAGRTFNHPYETYSNMRPSLRMKATIEDGDDACTQAIYLQQRAELMIEDHKQKMLRDIETLRTSSDRAGRIAALESSIRSNLAALEELAPDLAMQLTDGSERLP